MRIIHTADLHLGQIIYQNYDRTDEHEHFFSQLERWCREEKPDALVVSGDIFDIQQPGAATKKFFNDHFVSLARNNPGMAIVVIAGNHDSASRIQADRSVWALADAHLVGIAPAADLSAADAGWQDDYIVRLDSGYIVALPYMSSERKGVVQALLDAVESDNTDRKPVVLMGHAAIAGADMTGHGEIGLLRTQGLDSLGVGYDYLALGHIHKPQTLGHPDDAFTLTALTYPSGVARYSGSALHVSCDEAYPHTVSVVDIPERGADVTVRQLRIDELRHFYVLPEDGGSYSTDEEALKGIREFCRTHPGGYIRLRIDSKAVLASNFNQSVYDILAPYDEEIRYNPKTIWTGADTAETAEASKPVFEVADLQQMTDPMVFIEKTREQYPGLDMDMVRDAFKEVLAEVALLADEEKKNGRRGPKKASETVEAE